MHPFISYLVGLAPEGETALFVEQTSTGAWVPFMPEEYPTKQGALYANTASFIRERIARRLSVSANNAEYVLCLMLDDIGTKIEKTPPLAPTWIIETSAGSFQWGYAFSVQPKKSIFVALVKALAEAGYTDPGALGPARNFRLPGSVNLKPGRGMFQARLAEFNPSHEYTVDDIATACGVTLSDEGDNPLPPVELGDTGSDSVLNWLYTQGLVLEPPNQEGWVSVLCPNHKEHTTGDSTARYLPKTRAFSCFHGHCQGTTSTVFLEWIAKQGGPVVAAGLRADVLAAPMAQALAKIAPSQTFPTTPEEIRAGWFERYVYLSEDNAYFDMQDNVLVKRAAFDATYRGTAFKTRHGDRRVEASISFDEWRETFGGKVCKSLTYYPGAEPFLTVDGLEMANTWRDARPEPKRGDVSKWLDHVKYLVPDEVQRNHLLDMLAFKVQKPGIKICHALLIAGVEGAGKDTLLAPFFWAVGGATKKNCTIVETEGLADRWGYAKETEVMEICELRQSESKDRRALANKLKPVITAPPDWLSIEKKGQHPYNAINKILVIAYSNERDAIALSSEDRRWFCIWVDTPRLATHIAVSIWDWFRDDDGFAKVAGFLHDRDVSKFNPTAPPPATEAKAAMIESSRSPQESFLVDLISRRAGVFAAGAIASPLVSVLDKLAGVAPLNMQLNPHALRHALKEAGWVDLGQVKPYKQVGRCVYCAPDMKDKPKNELYEIAMS